MSKAVIFDMDGVICHTNPFHAQAFSRFFEKRNLFPTEEEYFQHMYGKNNGYILSHFLGRKIEGQELLDLEFEKESLFREIYKAHVDPITGFLEFFHGLKQAGEQVSKHKPDPEVYLKSAANMSLTPDRCLVFEDSFSGVSAAKNAGMKVVAVLSSHQKSDLPPCDWYIEDYSEIRPDLIHQLIP
jgi:HAD superfamily hydrolase (TIGR01509 family)